MSEQGIWRARPRAVDVRNVEKTIRGDLARFTRTGHGLSPEERQLLDLDREIARCHRRLAIIAKAKTRRPGRRVHVVMVTRSTIMARRIARPRTRRTPRPKPKAQSIGDSDGEPPSRRQASARRWS